MKKYNIAQIGTFDYENFGDLLFPEVLYENLSTKIEIGEHILLSPLGGRMPFYPDKYVSPINELEQLHLKYNFDAIIIGGGDVIRLDKIVAATENYNVEDAPVLLWVYPTLIANKYNIPLIWNCNGVPYKFNKKQLDLVELCLDNTDYISVRDEKSKEYLNQTMTKAVINVYPDSVLSMSNIISKQEIKTTFDEIKSRLCLNEDQEYIVFQSATAELKDDLNSIAKQLEKISDVFSYKIVLMPIGYVHEDVKVLTSIYKLCPEKFTLLTDKLSPIQMISVIANSKCFIGTSLHGSVISYTYGIRSIAYKVVDRIKLQGFYNLIDHKENTFSHAEELFNVFEKIIKQIYIINNNLINQCDEHFNQIKKIIEEGKHKSKSMLFENHLMKLLSNEYTIDNLFKGIYGNIYFNFGNGYTETNKVKCEYETNNDSISFSVVIPKNVMSIRFDPCENCNCIVSNLRAIFDNEQINGHNNGETINNTVVFNTTDPWFEFDINSKSDSMFVVNAELLLVDSKLVSLLFNPITELKNNLILNENLLIEFELNNKDLKLNNEELKLNNEELKLNNEELKLNNEELKLNNEELKLNNEELKLNNKELSFNAFVAQNNYSAIINSHSWKITKMCRITKDIMVKIKNSNPITKNFYIVLLSLKRAGVKATYFKVVSKFKRTQKSKQKYHKLTEKEIKLQKETKFIKNIKFSILVPLYNTPEKFLNEMIRSVKEQTYQNWELCLADGSNQDNKHVEEICKKYARLDKRIKYRKLEKNLGISENTNACIGMSSGEYIALFDHDDILHPAALFENMKAICEHDSDFIYSDENTFSNKPEDAFCPNFKPDFAIDTLRSYNYICHFSVFKKSLLDKAGNFRKDFDGSQDYDMVLRLAENAHKITHIPKILYYWRAHENSVASDISAKPYVIDAAKSALSEHLQRIGLKGEVVDSTILSTYKINYKIHGNPLVSILIPNKDNIEDLNKCLTSIFKKSTYTNYEIIVIENNSSEINTFKYYETLKVYKNLKVITWTGKFNYSAINNYGFKFTAGAQIILLNNDTEIISCNWIEELLMYSQRADVGAVGAKLYYPDDTIQHGGVILGIGGVGGTAHKFFDRKAYGYMSRLCIAQNFSCVTAACMMIPRHVFEEINGFDESFEVAFNDVDLCMRIRKAGYNIVWTPYAELYHYESKSRGFEDTPEKQKRFEGEVLRFQTRWRKELDAGDPYYNPNLTLEREDFSLRV